MSDDETLTSFLDKVDKISDLVKELKSADVEKSTAAIEKADAFLQADKPTGFDRTLVNTNSELNGSAEYSVVAEDNTNRKDKVSDVPVCTSNEYLRALEEDAKERSERRKAKEKLARENKRVGNIAFKRGDYDAAIAAYSEAIHEMPWDVTLYTNRAQIEPDHFKALIHKGKALCMLKNFDQAYAVYSEAMNVNPNDHQLIQGYIDQLEAQRNAMAND